MKILNLIEGVIQVPVATLNDGMNLICQDMFSKILTYATELEAGDDADEYYGLVSSYKQLHAQYSKVYGRIPLSRKDAAETTTGEIFLRANEINRRYLRTPVAADAIFKIKVVVEPAAGEVGGSIEWSNARRMLLTVTVPNAAGIQQLAKAPENFNAVMIELHATMKHELMHGIQRVAFNSMTDVDYYDAAGKIDDDKYHDSDTEYSPLIVSYAAKFKSFVMQHAIPSDNIKTWIASYVNPTAAVPDRFKAAITQPFFKRLYETDKAKWKKAVKYFYGLIQD